MSDNPSDIAIPVGTVAFHRPIQSYNFSFCNGTEVVGRLDFNGPKMTFEGDADASVELFVRAFGHWFDGRLKQEREAEREKVAQWMIRNGCATGHGDTTEDLLSELEWQVAEREREACARLVTNMVDNGFGVAERIIAAIRARGEP